MFFSDTSSARSVRVVRRLKLDLTVNLAFGKSN
jgi:hypothetical protein